MKTIKILFAFVFIIMITLPLLLLDRESPVSNLERRVLAQMPRITTNGKLDVNCLVTLPRQIDEYVTDRFAFRSQMITLIKKIDFCFLHKSHDDRLLIGKDRWLFYIHKSLGDEFANFKKTNLFTKDEMHIFLEQLTLVNETCEKNNIKFIFLVVPTTSSVYPEYYPFIRPEGISRMDQVLAAMPENIRKKTIFPLDHFIRKKTSRPSPLYYNNGLHWTKLGAYYAYELIYQKLKADFPQLPEVPYHFTSYIDPGEDNYAELWWGFKKFGRSLVLQNIEPENGWEYYYKYLVCENAEENEYNNVIGINSKKGKFGIITENRNQSLPTALVMRDSYYVDLEPFTSVIFSQAEYVWTQPEKRTVQYLADLPEKPDVFIWEIAERGLEAVPMMPPGVFPWD